MTNSELFEMAIRVIPGGVDSPVRAFRKVGGTPRFVSSAKGAYITDAEGKKYIDFVLSWGPMILGHCHEKVVEAVRKQASTGMSYGAPTELEVRMAEMICGAFASIDKVRFVNSGTEATMSAIRLARAFTGRNITLKFEGCYHGHVDSLLVKAGSGALTLGIADTAGIPDAIASTTAVIDYNDIDAFRAFMSARGSEVAAVIVEPVAGNMGVVLPAPGFLEALRDETAKAGSLLIFDEVITGFRFRFGGYQDEIGIKPDLTCLGKIIGGGLPVGAFGGRADIMEMLAPVGPVYQAGTLSGNPLAMAAGLATLEVLRDTDPYEGLEKSINRLLDAIQYEASRKGMPVSVNRIGSMASIFFSDKDIKGFSDVMASDTKAYTRFFHALLDDGIYLAPSPYEAMFISTAHGENEISKAIESAGKAFNIIDSDS
ncbi:MAG TPA: glutamate-1-semialdehyde 2,1-aminomutase [Desulfomonilia bacterium]